MSIQTSALIKSVTTTYSRWPMGETRLIMVAPSTFQTNQRLTLTQDTKEFKFLGRLYAETILRTDPFFAEYFAYLDSINQSPVPNQNITRYYGTSLSYKRVMPGGQYGTPFMRVK